MHVVACGRLARPAQCVLRAAGCALLHAVCVVAWPRSVLCYSAAALLPGVCTCHGPAPAGCVLISRLKYAAFSFALAAVCVVPLCITCSWQQHVTLLSSLHPSHTSVVSPSHRSMLWIIQSNLSGTPTCQSYHMQPLPRSSGVAAALHDGAPVCPECTAGLWSRLTFGWLSPLIKRGYKTPLTEADLWSLPPADRCDVCSFLQPAVQSRVAGG